MLELGLKSNKKMIELLSNSQIEINKSINKILIDTMKLIMITEKVAFNAFYTNENAIITSKCELKFFHF